MVQIEPEWIFNRRRVLTHFQVTTSKMSWKWLRRTVAQVYWSNKTIIKSKNIKLILNRETDDWNCSKDCCFKNLLSRFIIPSWLRRWTIMWKSIKSYRYISIVLFIPNLASAFCQILMHQHFFLEVCEVYNLKTHHWERKLSVKKTFRSWKIKISI